MRHWLQRAPLAVAVLAMTAGVNFLGATSGSAFPPCSSTSVSDTSELNSALAGVCFTIRIEPGTYDGPFVVSRTVNLVGASEGATILDGGTPVLDVVSGTVGVSNLTVTGGTDGSTFAGGGIDNDGTLTLNHVEVTANTTSASNPPYNCASAGGIYNADILTIANSAITRNTSTAFGCVGGLYNNGTVTISNTTISQNVQANPLSDVGGLLNNSTMNIYQSAVTNNSAYFDGGIVNFGTLFLSGTAVTGNTTAGSGGGIWSGNSLTIVGGLIAANVADSEGGGIFNAGGTVTMNGPTGVVHNFSPAGGGIFNAGGTVTLGEATVQNNRVDNCEGLSC